MDQSGFGIGFSHFRLTYGLPSLPRTTPLGNCFDCDLSVCVADSGSGSGIIGSPVVRVTEKRNCDSIGTSVQVRGIALPSSLAENFTAESAE